MKYLSHGLTYQLKYVALKDLAPPATGLKPAQIIELSPKIATET
jgi:hypothetical protein